MSLAPLSQARSHRRDRFAWYPYAEATWAIAAVLVVFAAPALVAPALVAPAEYSSPAVLVVFAVVVLPAPFFAAVRIVAAIADATDGGRR